jgi:hypothetical protein
MVIKANIRQRNWTEELRARRISREYHFSIETVALANSFHMGFSLETVNFLQLGN